MGHRSNRQEILGAVTDRQIAGLRFFLSLAAFLTIYFDSAEPDRFLQLTYLALLVYTVYSALVYCVARSVDSFSPVTNAVMISVDVIFHSLLVSITTGASSIFFFFYFFVIVTACSRLGADAG